MREVRILRLGGQNPKIPTYCIKTCAQCQHVVPHLFLSYL